MEDTHVIAEEMAHDQRLAWVLVLESMIQGGLAVTAKSIVVMDAQSEGAVTWYAWPSIFGDLAVETLLSPEIHTPEQDMATAALANDEFGSVLDSTEDQFLDVIRRGQGLASQSAPIEVDRDLWRKLAVCAVLARKQSLSAAEVLRQAEQRLAAEK